MLTVYAPTSSLLHASMHASPPTHAATIIIFFISSTYMLVVSPTQCMIKGNDTFYLRIPVGHERQSRCQ